MALTTSAFLGSSSIALQCTTLSNGLIPGCGQSVTVTPTKTGPQNIYIWTHNVGINGKISISQGGTVSNFNLPVLSVSATDEEQVTISISPTAPNTPYTISLVAESLQPGSGVGTISITSVAVGGLTAGNVSDSLLSTTGYIGTPSHSYGALVTQQDPPIRIPPATTSVTLCVQGKPSGCDKRTLQQAVNFYPGGTDIHLPLGFTSPQITLPSRADNGWVRVIADGVRKDGSSLSTFGVRANPVDYPSPGTLSSPAYIYSSTDDAAIKNDFTNATLSARAAHHYAFIGMEISSDGTVGTNYQLINLGPSGQNDSGQFGGPGNITSMPHDIIFQGMYIHRNQALVPNQANGMIVDAGAVGVYDSYISDIVAPGQGMENHAILFNTNPGPFTAKNNYFEAMSEDALMGGTMPQLLMVTQNEEWIGNCFDKNPAWNAQPYPAGIDPKNDLEFKEGQHVTVSGNVFIHDYAGSQQVGQMVFIRSTGFGGSVNRTTSNFLVQNNIGRHVGTGFQIEDHDTYGLGGGGYDARIPRHYVPEQYDILINNNIIEEISFTDYVKGRGVTSSVGCLTLFGLPTNFTFSNNTCQFSADDNSTDHYADFAVRVLNYSTLDSTQQSLHPTNCNDSMNSARTESLASWVFANNILSGEIGGDCSDGAVFFPPTMQQFTNNSFFNIDSVNLGPAAGYSPPFGGTGNTNTSSAVVPQVSGQGVDVSKLPTDCYVITGNRKDLPCVTGQ